VGTMLPRDRVDILTNLGYVPGLKYLLC